MTKRLFSAVVIIFLLNACVTKEKESNASISTTVEVAPNIDIRDLFYAIPSPLELSILFMNAGIAYDKDQLLSTAHAYQIENSEQQALLLGIYGADLSYSGIFKRPQWAIKYMAVCKVLAEELSIGHGFDEVMMQRIEANIQNKDSIVLIVANSFLNIDNYFKENKQTGNSTLVLIGGWIEGLHLGTTMIRTSDSDEKIKEIIKNQYVSLKNIILLAEASELKSQKWIIEDLKELLVSFEAIQPKTEGDSEINKSDDGMLTISSNSENTMVSDEDFNQINDQVEKLRTKLLEL